MKTLTKLGIRYYDPTLGRFTQPDPTGQDPHYTYARNNPVNFTDLSGAHAVERGGWASGARGSGGVGPPVRPDPDSYTPGTIQRIPNPGLNSEDNKRLGGRVIDLGLDIAEIFVRLFT